MENKGTIDVLIIGAGPSGLLLSYYLKQKKISHLIIEKGDSVGFSWKMMPDRLKLITFWKSNNLIDLDLDYFDRNIQVTKNDFFNYLTKFQTRFNLPIELKQNFTDLIKRENNFLVKTETNEYQAQIVVDARGYFSFPYIPCFINEKSNIEIIHSAKYKNPTQFQKHKRILIVGKRLSAGQIIEELFDANKEIFLSTKSLIQFSPPQWVMNIYLFYLNQLEKMIFYFDPSKKKNVDVKMDFKLKEILKKTKIFDQIEKIGHQQVYFKDGKTLEDVDAIIFATGFLPKNIELKNEFEDLILDNLFYIGRDNQLSFTSRFLRGIRRDVPKLANLIEGRLLSKNKSQ